MGIEGRFDADVGDACVPLAADAYPRAVDAEAREYLSLRYVLVYCRVLEGSCELLSSFDGQLKKECIAEHIVCLFYLAAAYGTADNGGADDAVCVAQLAHDIYLDAVLFADFAQRFTVALCALAEAVIYAADGSFTAQLFFEHYLHKVLAGHFLIVLEFGRKEILDTQLFKAALLFLVGEDHLYPAVVSLCGDRIGGKGEHRRLQALIFIFNRSADDKLMPSVHAVKKPQRAGGLFVCFFIVFKVYQAITPKVTSASF